MLRTDPVASADDDVVPYGATEQIDASADPCDVGRLADNPGFLAARFSFLAASIANRTLAPFDLRTRSYSVLELATVGDGMSQRDIGRILCLDKSHIVRLVDEVAGRGLVGPVQGRARRPRRDRPRNRGRSRARRARRSRVVRRVLDDARRPERRRPSGGAQGVEASRASVLNKSRPRSEASGHDAGIAMLRSRVASWRRWSDERLAKTFACAPATAAVAFA